MNMNMKMIGALTPPPGRPWASSLDQEGSVLQFPLSARRLGDYLSRLDRAMCLFNCPILAYN
jgi:hypothetical protein